MTDKNASLRQEDRVNKRAGHIAVGHKDRAIVWGGYLENQVDNDQYWNSSEVMVYNSLTQSLLAADPASRPATTEKTT